MISIQLPVRAENRFVVDANGRQVCVVAMRDDTVPSRDRFNEACEMADAIAAALNMSSAAPDPVATMRVAVAIDELRADGPSAEERIASALEVLEAPVEDGHDKVQPLPPPAVELDTMGAQRHGTADIPCFCGGVADIWSILRSGYEDAPDDQDARAYWCKCRACGCNGGWSKHEDGARDWWRICRSGRWELPSAPDLTALRGAGGRHAMTTLTAEEYDKRYPGYCRACHGWGGDFYSYDPSPSGVGLSAGSIQMGDPCPHCVEQDRCPRCGAMSYANGWQRDESGRVWVDLFDYGTPCIACGYKDGDKGRGLTAAELDAEYQEYEAARQAEANAEWWGRLSHAWEVSYEQEQRPLPE